MSPCYTIWQKLYQESVLDNVVLSGEEQKLVAEMSNHIIDAIKQANGRLPFDRYMELALYAPKLGYYVNGSRKFGIGGDFVTAPEISSLFSRCLATQCVQVLQSIDGGDVLEIGAGSGRMASDILAELERQDCLPNRYLILELSPDLQMAQHESITAHVPHLLSRVQWLQTLPDKGFCGVVVANELLDAMPVQRFSWHQGKVQELYVTLSEKGLQLQWGDVQTAGLTESVKRLEQQSGGFSDDYESEINLRLKPWLNALSERIDQAAVLLVDYGYTQAEYYLPERSKGTLICHFRHRAHGDAMLYPGLQDITANVDFTDVAEAAFDNGFEIDGFTTQAHFLLDNDLDRFVAESDPSDLKKHTEVVQQVKKLTMPGDMGEHFKVIGLSKNIDVPLRGFSSRNLVNRL